MEVQIENGDLEAVVSSALVAELQMGDFFKLRALLREWERDKKNFRVIHLTFSNRQFYIVKRQEYQRFREWCRRYGGEKLESNIGGNKETTVS